MRKAFLLSVFLLAVAAAAGAQTTVNFDTPACTGNGVKVYGGIDFSASPWDCEKTGIPGDATTTISWFSNIQAGTFKFVSPAVLVSIGLGNSNSGSGGTFTISTDAGESLTLAVSKNSLVNVTTNFTKAASVITVKFTGGWTLELDNIVYQAAAVTPPPATITAVSVSCAPTSIPASSTSLCSATVMGTGLFSTAVNWTTSDGSIGATTGLLAPSGKATAATVTATSVLDPTKSGSFTVAIALLPPTVNFSISGLPLSCTLSDGTLSCSNAAAPTTLTLACSNPNCVVTAPTASISLGTTSGGAHSATLTWTASTSTVSGYRVYRGAVSGAYGAPLARSLLTATTYTDTTAAAGATYFYVTTAVDSGGNESAFSNEVNASIPTP